MKRIYSLVTVFGLVLISCVSSYAQTRSFGTGALVLDDYHTHLVTLQAPVYMSPEWLEWQAASFVPLMWSVPVPPLNNAQAGFLLSGPLTSAITPPTRPYLPYWLPPGIGSISGDGNTGGYAGAWDWASYGQLGIVGGAGTPTFIPVWKSGDTTIGDSHLSDNNDTIYSSVPIQIKCTTSGSNLSSSTHFIDFIDGNGVNRGSVQGEDYADLTGDPAYQANEAAFVITTILSAVQILTGVAQGVFAILSAAAVVACAAGLFTIPAIPVATVQVVNLVTTIIQTFAGTGSLIATIVAYVISSSETVSNLGVQYSSQGADYAEYLMRENPNDQFYPGDIVGVRNGLISKNTEGAQSLLSISTAPIVIGNQPPKGQEVRYEKVGFLGQVPVKVRGIVHTGDFIMADGLNDGVGVAVTSAQITPQQFTTVIGRAWGSSESVGINIVKVAIGLSAKDMSEIASRQQSEIDSLKSTSEAENTFMNTRLDKLTQAFAQTDPAKKQALLNQAQQPMQLSQSQPGIAKSGSIQDQYQQLAQQSQAKPGAPQKKPTIAELMSNTEQLTLNTANKMISDGQFNFDVIDQIKQLKSYSAVRQMIHTNIQNILKSSDSPKTKGERVKQYLLHPDAVTSQAFGACALEAYPVLKSNAAAMTAAGTSSAR